MIDDNLESQSTVLAFFNPVRTRRLATVGRSVLRYGLVALLVIWGGFKFAAFEAEGIRPLVGNSPLLSWLYPLLRVRGTSALFGVFELVAALLICTRHWRPALSGIRRLPAQGHHPVGRSHLHRRRGAGRGQEARHGAPRDAGAGSLASISGWWGMAEGD